MRTTGAWIRVSFVLIVAMLAGAVGTAHAATGPTLTNPGAQTSVYGVATALTPVRSGGTAPFTWSATGLPAGLVISGSTGAITGAATLVGSSSVTVKVVDAAKASAAVSFGWTVKIAVTSPGGQVGTVGVAVNLAMTRAGGTSPFTWTASGLPAGLAITAGTGVISGAPTGAGGSTSVVTVTDTAGRTGGATFGWTVGTPPAIANPGARSATVGVATSLTMTATGGTSPYRWSATGLPVGLGVAAGTGVISGTPTAAGRSTAVVTVTDAAGLIGTMSFSWTTSVALAVSNPGPRYGTVGLPVTMTLAAASGSTPYVWSATGLPAGMSIAAGTAVISGTPTSAGNYSVALTVTDAAARTAAVTFGWVVTVPVTVTTGGPRAVTVGVPVSIAMAATGGAGSYTWSATGLPAGLSVNAGTGVFSGTPSGTGTTSGVVTATDSAGRTGTAPLTWISATVVTLTSPGARTGTVGNTASVQMSANGGTTPYAWAAAALPAGLAINAGTGVISGTPTTAGTSSVTVTVTDAGARVASVTFVWTIGTAPTVANPGPQYGTRGVQLSLALSATRGAAPYLWSATGLPAGVTINSSTGVVSGTPTTVATYPSTLTARDAAGVSGSTSVVWTIATPVTVADPGYVVVTAQQPENRAMSATGGGAPYRWSATGLPAGLAIDPATGTISGSAAEPADVDQQSYPVIVTATDAVARAGSVAFDYSVFRQVWLGGPDVIGASVYAYAGYNVGAAYLQVIDQTDNDRLVASCTGVMECGGPLDYKASGTHTYLARISAADGSQSRATSLPKSATFGYFDPTAPLPTIRHEIYYADPGPATSVLVVAVAVAVANSNVAASPYYLEIEDRSTGAVLASCGGGSRCPATISAAFTNHDIAVVLVTYDGLGLDQSLGGRTPVQGDREPFGKIDFGAWWLTLTPYTNGDGFWGFIATSNRYDNSVSNPSGSGAGGFILLDADTGARIAPVCGNAYRPATVYYEPVVPGDYRSGNYLPPHWVCTWQIPAAGIDPTHVFHVTVNSNAANECIPPYCGQQRNGSAAVALTDGVRWLYSGAFWRGGANPVTPPAEIAEGDIPAAGSAPAGVFTWWQRLNLVQRDYATATFPARLGALDGVPNTARNTANRAVLAQERTTLSADPTGNADKLGGIASVADALVQTTDAYLLAFSTDGNGRVVLSIGNPDTATNLATYVPGTGSKLKPDIGQDILRTQAMQSDAATVGGQQTAVILWAGYDAPQTVFPAATNQAYADAAAPDLRRFQDGIHRTHQGAPAHYTVLGHSYGSTTVGVTAHDGLAADDIVLVASPGAGDLVDKATDLHLTGHDSAAGHVWATTAPGDPISLALDPFWVLLPGELPGEHLINGENPTYPGFGAQVFTSGFPNTETSNAVHSQYWDAGNPARANFLNIIVGRYDRVS